MQLTGPERPPLRRVTRVSGPVFRRTSGKGQRPGSPPNAAGGEFYAPRFVNNGPAVRDALCPLVTRHGFHGAPMGAVAREAGVATGTP